MVGCRRRRDPKGRIRARRGPREVSPPPDFRKPFGGRSLASPGGASGPAPGGRGTGLAFEGDAKPAPDAHPRGISLKSVGPNLDAARPNVGAAGPKLDAPRGVSR